MWRSVPARCHALAVSVVPERRSRGDGIGWFAAGYAGVIAFFVLETSTRQRGAASSLKASRDDRGTTRMIIAAYATAVVVAPLVRALRRPRLHRAAGPVGVGLEAAGRGQEVVARGPYRFLRHPGYAGSLLFWTGFALTSRSVAVVEMVGGLLGLAYHRRVSAEEALLRRDLPGDAAYSRRTKRLIPFVW